MKLCRFKNAEGEVRVGLAVDDATIADLSGSGVESITSLLEDTNGTQKIRELAERDLPQVALGDVTLLTPVEGQEVWAAGVTYLRSKKARMEESDFSANAYDLVYEAARPEIFFKYYMIKYSVCAWLDDLQMSTQLAKFTNLHSYSFNSYI